MKKKKEGTKFDLLALAEYEKTAKISYVQVSDGSEIRILRSFAKPETKNPYTLVLVAGWSSLVLGWDTVLLESQDIFNIVYIETREKGSSKVSKKAIFDLERFALDIKEVVEDLELDQSAIVMLTTSFSSMLVAYLLKNKLINPFLSVFIGPIEKVPIPQAIKIMLAIFPKWLYPIVKKVGTWWVTHKAEDEEHGAKHARSLREADPIKWKKATKTLAQKNFRDVYEDIDNEVLVVDESEDKIHDTEITQDIVKSIKNCEYLDLKTNKNTHSKPIVDTILEYLNM
ncbi:MAG: hypothetical protein GOP50_01575 [Candidatus Heimdallarchaeota archaeon]|nr:hypothetical protein [Candidatus Heimdallarchaeota archaeon]